MAKTKFRDWSKADWSKSDKQISDIFGVTPAAVGYQRKKHTDYQSRSYTNIDWSSVDLQNDSIDDIATKLGVSKQAVSQRRYRERLQKNVFLRPKRSQWLLVDWRKSDILIAKELGVSRQAVHVKRKERENRVKKKQDG